jgi:hypothetical protein
MERVDRMVTSGVSSDHLAGRTARHRPGARNPDRGDPGSDCGGPRILPTGVGGGPHGMCVWPQPGRYSIGQTGILR